MPEGVQYSEIIDKMIEGKDGKVLLVMREDRPWDGSDQRIAELRKKINTYAAFALQGQLATDYPDLAGKPVSFELWCIQHRPDSNLMEILNRANSQLSQHSLQISVRVIEVANADLERQKHQLGGKAWWKFW